MVTSVREPPRRLGWNGSLSAARSAACAILVMVEPGEAPSRLDVVNTTATIVQSVLTSLAIVVGGAWALWEFGLKRVAVPRIEMEHQVTSLRIGPDYRLIHLSVTHENKGDTLVELGSADVRLQRVMPLSEPIKERLESGENPAEGAAVIPWPLLCRLKGDLSIELEPDEKHEVTFEFVIPAYVDAIRIYTYFPNASKSSREEKIGWSRTTIFQPGQVEKADDGFADISPRPDVPFACARDR